MSGDDIKGILQQIFNDQENCGFEAFLVLKKENEDKNKNDGSNDGSEVNPKRSRLRRITFFEGRAGSKDDSQNFKKSVKSMLFDVLEHSYLDPDLKYLPASKIADNQKNNIYIIEETEAYHPFDYLDKKCKAYEVDETRPYEEGDLENATALLFKLRLNDQIIWLYQYLWPLMIPNKHKESWMTQVFENDGKWFFGPQTNTLLTIAEKIDLIIVDDNIVTGNISLLQRSFQFHDFIRDTAHRVVEEINAKGLVENIDLIQKYADRKNAKYSRKLMRISGSKVLQMTPERLMYKIHTLDRWKGKFEENEDGTQIVLHNSTHVENLIDLLDERYTRSDVTDTEYDTDVKKVADPVE